MWPRDLLPQDLPTARIATWGYDADVVRFGVSVAGANNLRGHGKNLATDVGTWRARTETPDQRPIIFVAHSLGGLVVKQVYEPCIVLMAALTRSRL
jgi:pimeloyl-ACP methyl ester carboxylesterase